MCVNFFSVAEFPFCRVAAHYKTLKHGCSDFYKSAAHAASTQEAEQGDVWNGQYGVPR
jgi:hypothetical protein